MPEIATFLRSCPACGKRFETRLVSRELVRQSKEVARNSPVPQSIGANPTPYQDPWHPSLYQGYNWSYLTLEPNVVTITVRDEFQCLYRCKSCGHQWSEKRTSERKIS